MMHARHQHFDITVDVNMLMLALSSIHWVQPHSLEKEALWGYTMLNGSNWQTSSEASFCTLAFASMCHYFTHKSASVDSQQLCHSKISSLSCSVFSQSDYGRLLSDSRCECLPNCQRAMQTEDSFVEFFSVSVCPPGSDKLWWGFFFSCCYLPLEVRSEWFLLISHMVNSRWLPCVSQ